MPSYRSAGQQFHFSRPVLDLEPYRSEEDVLLPLIPVVPHSISGNRLISRVKSWIAGRQRTVEVYGAMDDLLLNVEGEGEFLITAGGQAISKRDAQDLWTRLDQEIALGPAFVLALALRGTWCLHASAALFAGKVLVFLGESGQGKSTLAAYLSADPNWRLVADDILPVTIDIAGITVWPHFPQLKLSVSAQPGPTLPESLPLDKICVLSPAAQDRLPELQQLPPKRSIEMFLRHTAGTRMFSPEMLGKHLSFCSQAARQVPTYQLAYPHRKDGLPRIRQLLESLC